MTRIQRPEKLSKFQDPPSPFSIYVQIFSTLLTLDIQFQTNPPHSSTNYGITTAPCMWTNEIKTKAKTKSRRIQIDHEFCCSI